MNHQRPVLTDPARIKVLACGRRWGKTTTGLIEAIEGHGPTRGYWRGALQGGRIWWLAPTSKTATPIWRELKRSTVNAWTDKSEVERRIELPGGGSVTVKSADEPDSLRGEGLDGAVLDEAAFMVQDVWQEVIRPALSDRQGWAAFKSTPNGFNWFEELFRTAAIEHGYARWQRPTSDNPLVPQAELDAAKRDLGPLAFSQEFEANFATRQGAEWPADYFGDHVWYRGPWPVNPSEYSHRYMALDPSKGMDAKKGDYSALIMLGVRGGKLYVDAKLARMPVSQIVDVGLECANSFAPHGFGIEGNAWQELIAADFVRTQAARNLHPLPIFTIDNRVNKVLRIQRIGPYLANRQVVFRDTPDCKLLVQQLREFPLGKHDDGPDALEMAIRLLNESTGQVSEHISGRVA